MKRRTFDSHSLPVAARLASELLLIGSCVGFASACAQADDEPATGEDGTEPVYAVMSQVFDAEGDRLVYVSLTKSLDFEEISLDAAREYPGVANIAAMGGRLFVSAGDDAVITQYAITDDLEWVEKGRIGFGGYPVGDNANLFAQFQVDDSTMYLPFDVSSRIVWDPSELEIKEVLKDSELEVTSGDLKLNGAGNHSRLQYEGNPLQAFFYHDEEWYDFGDASFIAVYDRESHEELDVLEGPCPGLAVNSMDENGNTYFSAWDYTPFLALYGEAPAPCVVKVTKGGKLDADFETDLSPLTGGRHLMNFRYVRDGWGLADVLHHELLDADFEGEPDPDVLDEIWSNSAFKLWRIDLEGGRAEPFDELGAAGMGWRTAVVDDRTFLFIPSPDWSSTTVFELDSKGEVTKLLEARGDVSWLQIR